MKGCFKFIFFSLALLCGVSLAWFYWVLTPEQRAAMHARDLEQRRAADAAAAVRREVAKEERERVDALKPEFITWLQRNAGVQTARFNPGITTDVLEVKFDRSWDSKDQARVQAEALAKAWRLRSGLDYAECAIYWGNDIYATGTSTTAHD